MRALAYERPALLEVGSFAELTQGWGDGFRRNKRRRKHHRRRHNRWCW